MNYYFVRATSNVGPLGFALAVKYGQSLAAAINQEATNRGIFVCSDWLTECIDWQTYTLLN